MKRKLLFAMLCIVSALGFKANAQPTASTPEVGKSYYLYNPKTGYFLTYTASTSPFVTGLGTAWTIIDGSSKEAGYVKLCVKGEDNAYLWGKYWAAIGNNDSDESYYKPIKQGESDNYKLLMYTWKSENGNVYINPGDKNRVAGNSQEQGGLDEGYILWEFVSEDDYAAYIKQTYSYSSDKDVSYFIADAAAAAGGAPAWCNGRTGSDQQYEGAPDNTYLDTWNDTRDQYQTIKNLPAGSYTLKAATRANGEVKTGNIYARVNDTNNSENIHKDGNTGGDLGNGWGWTEVNFYVPNNATTKIGFYSECGNGKWAGADNFTLKLVGTSLEYDAIEFTNGGELAEGKWYYYDGITTDGDYTLTASSDVTSIIYTTSGTQISVSATGTTCAASVAFAADTRVYFKSSSTQTLTISYIEPVVANGEYYLYNSATQKFLSRGANWGSRSTIDIYGIPVVWNNYTKCLQFKDTPSLYIFFDNIPASSWTYTDGGTDKEYRYFAFEAVEGGYILKDNNNTACLWTEDNAIVMPTAIANKANAIVWQLKTKSERDAIVATYPANNKTAVITAASLTSETDAAGFESWLAANRAAKDKTSSVGTARFTGSIGSWTWTGVRSQDKQPAYGTDWAEIFQATGDFSQEITGLSEGIYKVTVNAFERETGYATCNTLGAAGYEITTAYFEANGQKVQLKSWYSDKTGENNPDNTDQAATAFNNDKYKNEVYCYVSDDGKLTLTLAKPSYVSGSWVLFNNVTLTYYDTEVDDDDATAILSEASTTMESPMKHSLYEALNTAKETFDGSRTVLNYNALRTAIDNTATSIASYAAMYTNYLTPLATYFATTNFLQSDAYNTYLGYKNSYDNYKTTGADVDNATANALSVVKGYGKNYTSTYSLMMLPNWTKNGTPALDESGFYMNTWSTEDEGTGDAKDFANPFYEYWVGSESLAEATIVGTMTGLTPNKAYTVTANVRVQGSNKVAGSITMEVVGGVPVDVTDGNQIGETARYIKSYTATGVTDGDGKLVLKFNVAANSKISWLAFRDVNYATSEATISNDFTALNAAISTAESKTLGFEDGEYAPYNNVDAINKLKAAKDFDKTRYYIPSVITAATDAMTSATWTENVGEQNAIYWADYTSGDIAADTYIHPLGWTNTGYNTRVYSEAAGNKGDNTGISAVNNLAIMMKYNTTYGETTGYTMPLKAGTIYKISFKYCGWGNDPTTNIVLTDPSANTITLAPGFRPATNDGNTNAEHWYDYTGYFVSTTAGNYVLAMNKVDGGQQQIGIGNIELVSASEIVFADGSVPTYAPGTYPSVKITRTLTANRWATAIYPFAVSGVDNIAVLNSYDNENGDLGFTSAAASTANEPFLMMSTTNKSYITLSNVEVAAANATPATASEASLIGAYTATDITNAEKNYVLSSNTIYSVGENGATIKPYRAYIQIAVNSPAKALRFVVDGQATNVTTPEVAETEEEEILFNMAGIQVDKNFKGFVVNQKGEKRFNR